MPSAQEGVCSLLVLPSWVSANILVAFLSCLLELLGLTKKTPKEFAWGSVNFLVAFFALCGLLVLPSWASA